MLLLFCIASLLVNPFAKEQIQWFILVTKSRHSETKKVTPMSYFTTQEKNVIAKRLILQEDTKDTDIFSVYDVESGKVLKHARFVRIEKDNYHYYKLESSDPEEESVV